MVSGAGWSCEKVAGMEESSQDTTASQMQRNGRIYLYISILRGSYQHAVKE